MLDFIKKGAAVLIALTIVGCSSDNGYRTEISNEEYETDYSTVYAEIIEFGGMENREFQSELNEQIEDDVKNSIGAFDSLAQEVADTLPEGVKSALSIRQNVKRNSGGIISLITEEYVYLGGAHGTTSWLPYTADARSEEPHILEIRELFKDEDGYIDTINRLIDELVTNNPETYSELWAEPHITKEDQRQFYLTDEELVIFFPPYELSYYAKGFIEFPIRLSEIAGELKDQFKVKN